MKIFANCSTVHVIYFMYQNKRLEKLINTDLKVEGSAGRLQTVVVPAKNFFNYYS